MLIDRYLMREIGTSFAAVAVVLTVIFLSYSLSRYLTDAASGLFEAAEVARLTFYKSIIALEVLLPLAFYFGVIVGFGRLSGSSELMALRACGLREARLKRPLFVAALLLAAVVAAFSFNVRPQAYAEIYAMKDAAEAAAELDRIRPRRFYLYENTERAVYVDDIADKGRELRGVFIRDRGERELEVISAVSGRLEAYVTADSHRLVLSDASIVRSVARGRDFSGRFDTLTLNVRAENPVAYRYRTKAEPTTGLALSPAAADRAELQWRLSTPLSTILLALTALSMSAPQPREGRFARLPLAVGIYAVYYNLLGVGRSWVEQQAMSSLWWVPGLLAAGLALNLLRRRRTLA
ncbi:MAG: LPS export ABC transporter permease LptF [Gammaproteobacteria bacterium]